MALTAAIEDRWKGDDARDLTFAIAGCPRNCPEALTSEVGAIAIGGGNWDIHVGGIVGPMPCRGEVLRTVGDEEGVLRAVARFVALYRREAGRDETAAVFVARRGIARIRAEVGEAGDGEIEDVGDRADIAAPFAATLAAPFAATSPGGIAPSQPMTPGG